MRRPTRSRRPSGVRSPAIIRTKVLDFVRMIAGDLTPEGLLDLVGRRVGRDREHGVEVPQRFGFLNSATFPAGSSGVRRWSRNCFLEGLAAVLVAQYGQNCHPAVS